MVSNPLEQAAVEQVEETIGIERSDAPGGGRSGLRVDKAKMEVVVLVIPEVMEVALTELAITEAIQVSMVCTSFKQRAFK